MKKNYSAPRIQVIEMGNEGVICLSNGGDGNGRPASAPIFHSEEWEANETEYRSHL